MNGNNLLLGLSYIDRKFIEESETDTVFEKREAYAGRGKRTIRRPLLIAAVIALILMLVGCAVVYVLHLRDLKIGEWTHTQSRYIDADGNKVYETEVVREVLSLQGVTGSPNFQAAQEWFAFEQKYDQDRTLLDEAEENPIEVPREYDAYFVYNQEMLDKVDEIARKYGLELAGESAGVQAYENEIFFDSLGIDQLHRKDTDASVRYSAGYFYACGNFDMAFYIALPGERSSAPREVLGSYRYNGKAYFDTVYGVIDSGGNYEEWNYEASDGQEVLIVMDDQYARIFCDREDAFVSLFLNRIYRNEDGTEGSLTRQEVEQIVQCMDFTVTPQKPDMERAKEELQASAEAYQKEQEAKKPAEHDSYDSVIQTLLNNGVDPEEYDYALRDVTGDGVEELLGGKDGTFGWIRTMDGGKVTTICSRGMDFGFRLCEGNIVKYSEGNGESEHCYFLSFDPDAGMFSPFLYLGYDPWEEQWYRSEDGLNKEYISREEFDRIVSGYKVIDIGMKPISEYPFS